LRSGWRDTPLVWNPAMNRLILAFRMLVGLSMVAGGVVLVTPLTSRLVTAAAAGRASSTVAAQATLPAAGLPAADLPPAAAAPCVVAQKQEPSAVFPGMDPPFDRMVPGQLPAPEPPPLQQAYRPPPPPPALGSAPQEFMLPQPGMPDLYRAAHGAPPPPLLDGPRPEGVRGFGPGLGDPALDGAWSISARSIGPPSPHLPLAVDVPRSTYRVRDGDDLTGIAARLYGHPAAAAAIWEVNRDRLVDPSLLPIGMDLRLPAPWEIDLHPGSAAAIEPRRAAAAVAGSSEPPRPAVPAAPWLGNSGAAATPASWPLTQPTAPVSGGRIVVAPGETLMSLATRLYGDPTAARRIWEVNRDRLRGPELLVPGMELRLP
jgi:nucleoid-associated protein YgaU